MIGVYDSGMGGLTVLAHLLKEMPHEDYFYLADYKEVPYGEKEKEELEKIIMDRIQFLIQKGCKMIVIACNTVGTFKDQIRKNFTLPIIIIEPAIKMVYDHYQNEKTLLLATPYTIKSEKFQNLMNQYGTDEVTLLACEGLASLIEEGDKEKIEAYLLKKLKPYLDTSNVILGCTHYPLIQKEIQKILPQAHFFDGGKGVAKQTKKVLLTNQLETKNKKGTITFYFTDKKDRTDFFLKKLNTYTKEMEI